MNTTTVLLLGGPKDGELLAVQNHMAIAVMEIDHAPEASYTWDSASPAEVRTKVRYYIGGRVAMFGHMLRVYTYENLSEQEQAERAFEHLASDKAKAVVVR